MAMSTIAFRGPYLIELCGDCVEAVSISSRKLSNSSGEYR
jgi:hypothetical protein